MKLQKVRIHREELGRAELKRKTRDERREEGDHDRQRPNAPTNEDVNAAVSASPARPTLRHRIPVERRRDGPRLAGDVEQYRGDGPAEERSPIDTGKHDDRGSGRHRERERQENGDTVRAAEPGKHADDDPEAHADEHEQKIERRQRDREAVKQCRDISHCCSCLPRSVSGSANRFERAFVERHLKPDLECDERERAHAKPDQQASRPAVAAQPDHESCDVKS